MKLLRTITASMAVLLLAGAASAQFLMVGQIETSTGTATTRLIQGQGPVTQTPGGSLMIPANSFQLTDTTLRVFTFAPTYAQVASAFTSSNAAVTVMAGGGPGSFSWCPRLVVPCTDPDNAVPNNFHGQLVYTAGAAGFGGTFEVLRSNLSSLSVRVAPNTYSHTDSTVTNSWHGGIGSGLPTPATQTSRGGPKVVTTGAILGVSGSIQTLGNLVGTSAADPTEFRTGFPATTGQVFAFDRTGMGGSKFTWTGSDNRNANGHGTITLVASGYTNNLAGRVTPGRLTVNMSILPAVPTMGAPGIAALGILLLLGAGFGLRRRL